MKHFILGLQIVARENLTQRISLNMKLLTVTGIQSLRQNV